MGTSTTPLKAAMGFLLLLTALDAAYHAGYKIGRRSMFNDVIACLSDRSCIDGPKGAAQHVRAI